MPPPTVPPPKIPRVTVSPAPPEDIPIDEEVMAEADRMEWRAVGEMVAGAKDLTRPKATAAM